MAAPRSPTFSRSRFLLPLIGIVNAKLERSFVNAPSVPARDPQKQIRDARPERALFLQITSLASTCAT